MSNSRLIGITALGGFLSATLAFLPVWGPFFALFSFFVPLPFFLLGLGLGLRPLLGAGLFAIAFVFLFTDLVLTTEFFLCSFLGPVFLVQRALLNQKQSSGEIVWYSPSFLLKDFTLLSGIVMTVALGVYLYLVQNGGIDAMLRILDSQGHIKKDVFMQLLSFLPGFFTFSWMLMMLFNAAIAQGILTRIKANLRPTPSFKMIQIPKNFLIVLGLSLLLSYIGVGTLELLGKNATLTLSFPFFLSGIGIIHLLFHKTAFATVGLIIFYCALLLLLWPAFFVIFLGILRPWIEKFRMTN